MVSFTLGQGFSTWVSEPQGFTRFPGVLGCSGGSWWNWPGGLRDFISGWTYGIVALAVFI